MDESRVFVFMVYLCYTIMVKKSLGVVLMEEKLQVGDIVTGKVTGIKPFGAFVAIDDQHQGLVHISEVSHSYVKEISNFVNVGDEVKVKILSIDEEAGKISLSIRKTEPEPEKQAVKKPSHKPNRVKAPKDNAQGFNTLEQKLKEWLKESNEKQAQLNKRLKK